MKQQQHHENEPTLFQSILFYVFLMLLLLLSIYLSILLFAGEPIAKHKAKSSVNIKQGCLYYIGNFNKNMAHSGRINNEKTGTTLHSMQIKSFPAYYKNVVEFDLQKINVCYKIKYVLVDFNIFTNYSFLRYYYIYDYID